MARGRTLTGWLDACADWLTTPVAPQPLAAYRICLGLLLACDGLLVMPDLEMWFTEAGVLPNAVRQQLSPRLGTGLFTLIGDGLPAVHAVHGALLLAAVALLVGYRPRLAAAVAFACLVSFAHRNVFTLHSGDTFIRLMTFFMIFAPSNAAFRLGGGPRQSLIDPVAFRVMQFQVCLVYATTFLFKIQGVWWRDGSAVYIVQQLGEFQGFPVPWWARNSVVSTALTWSTLLVEGAFPVLVWVPTLRLPILAAATAMHLGIEYSMCIRLFEWALIATFTLFLKPEELDAFTAWGRRCSRAVTSGLGKTRPARRNP